MGWDGYACRVVQDTFYKEDILDSLHMDDPVHQAFRDAASNVPGLELFLDCARLGCRASASALARATGEEPYNTEWWPDKVQELAKKAEWSFQVDVENEGAKASAKLFLELCAEHNLGVRFD